MTNIFPIDYQTPVFRPPAEAYSLLVQVTLGCSHNRCLFCAMYKNKEYRVRRCEDIAAELESAAHFYRLHGEKVRKVFLCDGDALSAPTGLLVETLKRIHCLFPSVKRVGVYASARNVLEKTEEELTLLSSLKLSIAYLGLESGSDEVLKLTAKGNTAAEALEAAERLRRTGWQLSVIVMLGLGGRACIPDHRSETAKITSRMAPDFLSFLTTIPVPGTPYSALIDKGRIQPLTTRELLEEELFLVEHFEPAGSKTIFRANHVSNQLPLEGILPRDRSKLAETLKEWISKCPAGHYPKQDPWML